MKSGWVQYGHFYRICGLLLGGTQKVKWEDYTWVFSSQKYKNKFRIETWVANDNLSNQIIRIKKYYKDNRLPEQITFDATKGEHVLNYTFYAEFMLVY